MPRAIANKNTAVMCGTVELKFNNNKPDGIEAKILFARFYDSIRTWYEDPTNKRRFEEWQKIRSG